MRDRADGFKDDQGADATDDAFQLVGYCSEANLPQFVLDPPRGKAHRVAFVIFTRADEEGGLEMHKLEHVEPENVENAAECMKKLRTLTRNVRATNPTALSHTLSLDAIGTPSPSAAKKSKDLAIVSY